MVSPDDPTLASESCPDCGGPLSGPSSSCPACAETRVTAMDRHAGTGFTGPRRIAGYRILRELGAGGMGTVFEAYEEKMDRRVALKVLSRHHAPSDKVARRFEKEAWITGKLDHPNIVKVYERGEWEELAYYSMEIVTGGSLDDVIGNLKRWGRDDTWELTFGTREYVHWAITQVVTAARALEQAHRHGVVHRDVKPMNLLLSRELGAVKIADFGLAVDLEGTRMTTEGKLLGTMAFMAPEQLLGKVREIGPPTDVYALGVTLFELLTLEMPYTGKTQQLYMNAVLTTEARRPRKLNNQVSSDLETVIRKALEKNAADRYPTAGALADDLENVLHLRPIDARPPSWVSRLTKWLRRKPVHAALLATLLVGLPVVGLLGYQWTEQRRTERSERTVGLLFEGLRLNGRGRHLEAIAKADEVLRLDSRSPQALRVRAMARASLARSADLSERAQLEGQALADVARSVELRPDESWVHAARGYVLQKLDREQDAEAAFAEARRLRTGAPTQGEIALDGETALDAGDHARAVELFDQAYALNPRSTWVIGGRGMAHDALGHTERAIADYRLALGLNPEMLETLINLAKALVDRGELEEAGTWLDKAGQLAPDNALLQEIRSYYLHSRGVREMAADNLEGARRWLAEAERAARRSLALNPDQLMAATNLAAILLDRNRVVEQPDPGLVQEALERYSSVVSRWEARPPGEAGEAYDKALVNSCDALIQVEQLERALSVCTEVAVNTPHDAVAHYNLAGVYALTGRVEEAFGALERDFELGDTDWRYLEGDDWFAGLRQDPRFGDLIGRMRKADGSAP